MISASPSKKQHFTGQWPGCTTVLPEQGEVRINAAFFRKFDFSSATVRTTQNPIFFFSGWFFEVIFHLYPRVEAFNAAVPISSHYTQRDKLLHLEFFLSS
jgi:hypothetical protein